MHILRFLLGVIMGLFMITFITESIEFLTVKLISGQPFSDLTSNQEEYLAVRNQGGVLAFKMVYNFFASVCGGFVAAWVAKKYAFRAVLTLIIIQSVALIWAGFISEYASTGPMWMWLLLTLLTPVGVYLGYRAWGTQHRQKKPTQLHST